MPKHNYVDAEVRKRFDREAQAAKKDETADPLAGLPKRFLVVAKAVNDGQEIRVFFPSEFIGRHIILETSYLAAFYITGGIGYEVKKGFHKDADGNEYGGFARLPAELLGLSLNRDGSARHVCKREARKILFNTLLRKLTVGYTRGIKSPTHLRGVDLEKKSSAVTKVYDQTHAVPAVVATALAMPPNLIKEELKPLPSLSEREQLKVAQSIINEAILTKGYSIHLRHDNTIKLTMEI